MSELQSWMLKVCRCAYNFRPDTRWTIAITCWGQVDWLDKHACVWLCTDSVENRSMCGMLWSYSIRLHMQYGNEWQWGYCSENVCFSVLVYGQCPNSMCDIIGDSSIELCEFSQTQLELVNNGERDLFTTPIIMSVVTVHGPQIYAALRRS